MSPFGHVAVQRAFAHLKKFTYAIGNHATALLGYHSVRDDTRNKRPCNYLVCRDHIHGGNTILDGDAQLILGQVHPSCHVNSF